MEKKSLNVNSVANISETELGKIKELESKLDNKYYLIAFSK